MIGDHSKKREATRDKQATELMEMTKPLLLDASEHSDDMKIQKEHELMKINLHKFGIQEPDKVNTLQFFSMVEELDKQELNNKQITNGRGKA